MDHLPLQVVLRGCLVELLFDESDVLVDRLQTSATTAGLSCLAAIQCRSYQELLLEGLLQVMAASAGRAVEPNASSIAVSKPALGWRFELGLFTVVLERCSSLDSTPECLASGSSRLTWPQGVNLIFTPVNGAPALSVKRIAHCQLFWRLKTLNTTTLMPFFRVTRPLSPSSSRMRASVNA
jgi:hypothetical protein